MTKPRVRPLRSEADLVQALSDIEQLWDAKPGSDEADVLEVLTILVEQYERTHYPIHPPDPVEAIKFRMDQGGLTNEDLREVLGGKSRVSEILNRQRPLSVTMMRELHKKWGIPAEVLLFPVVLRTVRGKASTAKTEPASKRAKPTSSA